MKIAVTSKSFSENSTLTNELAEKFDTIKINLTGKTLEGGELVDFVYDSEAIIVGLEKFDRQIIDSCRNLQIIAKFGVGLDNIDLDYCKQKGIKIGWQQGVNKRSVAEMTAGFMLMLARNLYITSNLLKNGSWYKNGGFELSGKSIGIIGLGNIGKEVVRLLVPFGCHILVNDLTLDLEFCREYNLSPMDKETIYKEADIISIHTPLNESTYRLVNREMLGLMKETSFLINTARGEIVDLDALKVVLRDKKIAGAAIDVYHEEPPKDSELISIPNLITTPHIGGNSKEAVLAMGRSAIECINDFYNNQGHKK